MTADTTQRAVKAVAFRHLRVHRHRRPGGGACRDLLFRAAQAHQVGGEIVQVPLRKIGVVRHHGARLELPRRFQVGDLVTHVRYQLAGDGQVRTVALGAEQGVGVMGEVARLAHVTLLCARCPAGGNVLRTDIERVAVGAAVGQVHLVAAVGLPGEVRPAGVLQHLARLPVPGPIGGWHLFDAARHDHVERQREQRHHRHQCAQGVVAHVAGGALAMPAVQGPDGEDQKAEKDAEGDRPVGSGGARCGMVGGALGQCRRGAHQIQGSADKTRAAACCHCPIHAGTSCPASPCRA